MLWGRRTEVSVSLLPVSWGCSLLPQASLSFLASWFPLSSKPATENLPTINPFHASISLSLGRSQSLLRTKAALVAQLVKNLPAVWETWVQSLGWEDALEKGKATHSSILAWRMGSPWTTVHGVSKSWT